MIGGASADVDVASAKGRWFQSDWRTVRIVSNNLSGVNGFSRHAWKSALSMYARSSSSKKAVIAITGNTASEIRSQSSNCAHDKPW